METTKKHDPGVKGLEKMQSHSLEELKELRREIIQFTRQLIGRGITSYAAKQEKLIERYGVSTRQAKKYIAWTREDIRKRKNEEQEAERDEVLIQLKQLYADLYAAGNLVGASKVLDQLIKLRGYEAPKAIMVSTQTTITHDISHLSVEALRAMEQIYLTGSPALQLPEAAQE